MDKKIRELLETHFKPSKLEILDFSQDHAGHNPQAAKGGTHWSLLIVSDKFSGLSMVMRHRQVYQVLDQFLKNQIHALKLITLTNSEYQNKPH